MAKNCTSLTMMYLDRCGKVAGAGIEALAQSCPSVNNVDLDRCDKVTPLCPLKSCSAAFWMLSSAPASWTSLCKTAC